MGTAGEAESPTFQVRVSRTALPPCNFLLIVSAIYIHHARNHANRHRCRRVIPRVVCHEPSQYRSISPFLASRFRFTDDRQGGRQIPWSKPSDCVSLGRTKADSPSPRNGSEYPVSQVGSRTIPRVLQTGDGECLNHGNTMGLFIDARTARFYGCAIGTATVSPVGNLPVPRTGGKPIECFERGFKPGMATF